MAVCMLLSCQTCSDPFYFLARQSSLWYVSIDKRSRVYAVLVFCFCTQLRIRPRRGATNVITYHNLAPDSPRSGHFMRLFSIVRVSCSYSKQDYLPNYSEVENNVIHSNTTYMFICTSNHLVYQKIIFCKLCNYLKGLQVYNLKFRYKWYVTFCMIAFIAPKLAFNIIYIHKYIYM